MSVLIQGMEMPDDCYSCPFRELVDRDTDICFITGERFSALFTLNQQKNADCPLVEIPPHGRLIDADDLFQLLDGGYDVDMDDLPETKAALLEMITNAPTIIPGDKEEQP